MKKKFPQTSTFHVVNFIRDFTWLNGKLVFPSLLASYTSSHEHVPRECVWEEEGRSGRTECLVGPPTQHWLDRHNSRHSSRSLPPRLCYLYGERWLATEMPSITATVMRSRCMQYFLDLWLNYGLAPSSLHYFFPWFSRRYSSGDPFAPASFHFPRSCSLFLPSPLSLLMCPPVSPPHAQRRQVKFIGLVSFFCLDVSYSLFKC